MVKKRGAVRGGPSWLQLPSLSGKGHFFPRKGVGGFYLVSVVIIVMEGGGVASLKGMGGGSLHIGKISTSDGKTRKFHGNRRRKTMLSSTEI